MPNQHIQDILKNQDVLLALEKQRCEELYGDSVLNKYQNPFYNETTKSK